MEDDDSNGGLWVFAYGSLCWRPGFEYGDSVLGHIEGFSRRFWQGNTTHRGTPDKVGEQDETSSTAVFKEANGTI